MTINLATRTAAVAALLAGGCASGAWRFADAGTPTPSPPAVVTLPPHRAVERVTLRTHGHEFEFVGYRACDPRTRAVRVQLLLDSGLSVLDAAVRGGEDRRLGGSVFEAIPRFALTAMEDLRRVWGSQSLFAATKADAVVTDGGAPVAASRVGGGWLARALVPGGNGAIRLTILDERLVPLARVDYADFDEQGFPREIDVLDLEHEHEVHVEVEEVHAVADPVPASTFETPAQGGP